MRIKHSIECGLSTVSICSIGSDCKMSIHNNSLASKISFYNCNFLHYFHVILLNLTNLEVML